MFTRVIRARVAQIAGPVVQAGDSMSPDEYRLIVEGELGPRYTSAFEGMTIFAHDGITEISGPIIDPSHLQGVMDRISGLGLTLRSLAPLNTEDA